MKRVLFVLILMSLGLSALMADLNDDIKKEIRVEMEKNFSDVPGSPKVVMNIRKEFNPDPDSPDAAFMGIYSEDLNFPKAQELEYKGYYGILVTGIVSGSPAWEQRLQENDIILSMDGKEVTNSAVFERLRKMYRANDTVSMELFRMGEVIKVDFTFGTRNSPNTNEPNDQDKPEKRRKSVGYGGGSWIPMWFNTDMTDVNQLMSELGFTEMLDDNGVLMQGIGGKVNIGKGFFIGGQVTTYEDTPKTFDPVDPTYSVWMRYNNTMGGVTLDKRFAITKNLIVSTGFLLGGASHTVEILKSNSNYNWGDGVAPSEIYSTFLGSNNNHAEIFRKYLIVQPKAELMVHFLPWFGIRAEAGYTYGYSPKNGWRVKGLDQENFIVKNSPNTEYQGLNLSIGPWFGF
ncbi:MAG: PDZ domain-containing protein [Candidatus Cloacimonetes bacterium]|nr:PDZ domain-containing protein [Candidatus Cloacimonadota bacterium]